MMRPSEALIGQSIVNEQQIIVEVSDHFVDMVRLDRSALIGRHALSFTFGADLSRNVTMLDSLVRAGPDFAITKCYVQGDGGLIWVQNQVSAHRDFMGNRYFCATSQKIDEDIRSEVLVKRYDAVRRICALIVAGRANFGSDVVSLPTTEALLLLYKAEIEGSSLTIDDLARHASISTSSMLRWVAYLHKRRLVQIDEGFEVAPHTHVRIDQKCEQVLDGLLVDS